MNGYIQDDKNTLYLPRQEMLIGIKFFDLEEFLNETYDFYNRFTTFERRSDVILTVYMTISMKNILYKKIKWW